MYYNLPNLQYYQIWEIYISKIGHSIFYFLQLDLHHIYQILLLLLGHLHLHYLLATFFKNRFNLKKKSSDIFTSLLVGIYNYFIFYYSINFISRTKNLITIILINILLYSIIYIILKNLKMRRKLLK